MKKHKFPSNIHKELKNYIYALYDPSNVSDLPFYIGRGVGDRVFSHLKESHNDEVQQKIKELRENGFQPNIKIILHGLSVQQAKAAETVSIAMLGKDKLAATCKAGSGLAQLSKLWRNFAVAAAVELKPTHHVM